MAPLTKQQPLRPAAPPPPPPSMIHFTHPHHPVHTSYVHQEFSCDGCHILGQGNVYRCNPCNFDLHHACATATSSTHSPLHPGHPLNLYNGDLPGYQHECDLCGESANGLRYTCTLCNFDVHPLCLQLPHMISHPLDPQHPLTLQPGVQAARCDVCFGTCGGGAWRYSCQMCLRDVHLECLNGPRSPAKSVWTGQAQIQQPVPFGVLGQPVNNLGQQQQLQQPGPGVNKGNGNRRKIYAMLGGVAVKTVIGAVVGIPFS